MSVNISLLDFLKMFLKYVLCLSAKNINIGLGLVINTVLIWKQK